MGSCSGCTQQAPAQTTGENSIMLASLMGFFFFSKILYSSIKENRNPRRIRWASATNSERKMIEPPPPPPLSKQEAGDWIGTRAAVYRPGPGR
jgi:hypothetical protein